MFIDQTGEDPLDGVTLLARRVQIRPQHLSNHAAEQAIRMSKLRIKIPGCMRCMAGADEPCALRPYLATAARHGIGALDTLTAAFQGKPWIPETE